MEFLTKHLERIESLRANSNAKNVQLWWRPTAKDYEASKTNPSFFSFIIFQRARGCLSQ
jgi:hypothetical protein